MKSSRIREALGVNGNNHTLRSGGNCGQTTAAIVAEVEDTRGWKEGEVRGRPIGTTRDGERQAKFSDIRWELCVPMRHEDYEVIRQIEQIERAKVGEVAA